VRVIGFARRDGEAGPESYELKGTPCHQVIDSRSSHCVVEDARGLYPSDELFAEFAIESYVGIPLRDAFGRTFGLVCVFDDRPRRDTDKVLALIEWLGRRIGNEAGSLRTRRNLANSVRWMAPSQARDVFLNATAHLCEVLQVTTSLIMEWPEDQPGYARTMTLLHQGQRLETGDSQKPVALADTCFAGLELQDLLVYSEELASASPECAVLSGLGLNSCLAFAIKDHDGRKIGHLAVAHTGVLEPALVHSPVLALYLARVTAELERLATDRERAAIERSLDVKHKLESLGLMAGHVAHDFNNLLMAILGNANLAADQLDPESPGRKYLENIEAAATSAGDVVSQLLDYAGRKPTRASPLDVSQAVASASKLVALTRTPDVSIEYDLAEGLPLVEADPAQIQQIIINLVLNATESLHGQRGDIGVSVAQTELAERDIHRLILGRELSPGRYVEVSVRDSGAGMDDATLSRIFDPFFTSKPDGRGLGLSAVRGFVQGCGGGLRIRTQLGEGTELSLFLQPAEDSASAQPEMLPASTRARRILVVDDEALVAETTGVMLQSRGHEVEMALSCEEALACARSRSFDCALIDIRMPGIDGWTTLRRLRALQPELPAVMMTGYANEARATELMERFEVSVVYKPYKLAELEAALVNATESLENPV